MEKINKDILILVKTYPALSKKYKEVVCTAGIDKDGKWFRVYPIPFRDLKYKYKKYQWINANIWKNKEDHRIESYKIDYETIKITNEIKKSFEKQKIINKTKIYTNLSELINDNKKGMVSLATFKPNQILSLEYEKLPHNKLEHKEATVNAVYNDTLQQDFFKEVKPIDINKLMPKLPYKFSYKFKDDRGKISTLMIEDWEIGQLYWNCLKRASNNEEIAIKKVKEKYYDDFAKNKDIKLFLGTTKLYDKWASNPFVITGVCYFKKPEPLSLFKNI